jgi:hypothetical protein
MDKNLKDLLYRSFDSDLDQQEKSILENALAGSAELRQEKEMIESLRQDILGVKDTSFKPGFADRVMNEISKQKSDSENEPLFESLFVVFRPIAIAATVLIIVIAGYNMSSTCEFSVEGALGIPEVTVEDVYDPSLALVTEE